MFLYPFLQYISHKSTCVSAASLYLLRLAPADFGAFPCASLALCAVPRLARTTYLWNVLCAIISPLKKNYHTIIWLNIENSILKLILISCTNDYLSNTAPAKWPPAVRRIVQVIWDGSSILNETRSSSVAGWFYRKVNFLELKAFNFM